MWYLVKKNYFCTLNSETMAKKTGKGSDSFVAVESALGKTEQMIEKNQKYILIIVGIIVVIVLGYFAYKKLYIAPLNQEAQEQMFMAEMYFEQQNFEKALYGDGNYLGFLDVIDEYGNTKSGNLSNYYTGVIYLKQGKFDEALGYLKRFESDDQIIGPMALGAIGDAYIEKDEPGNAIDYYLKAANTHQNEFVTPMFLLKAGWAYEMLGEYNKALRTFERIRNEYPKSLEARDVERYIDRAKAMTGRK